MAELGPVGVWSPELRLGELGEARESAAELEELGFSTLWIPGRGEGVFERADELLGATSRAAVATGIVSIWNYPAGVAAPAHVALHARHPGRFVLGLGVSHAKMVDEGGEQRYRKPLALMRSYLDELDASSPPVPQPERMIAALAPRMLELARDRTAGSHPYLVSPVHTRWAREHVGPGTLLAPEQTAILSTDAGTARAGARAFLANPYLGLENYRRNFMRQGFDEADLENGGSDRFVDAIVAWGDAAAIAARVREHHDAGADHVCLQVLSSDGSRGKRFPRAEWRELASALADVAPTGR